MQDIYGPERDYGDICDEAYDKWKQEDIECKAARVARVAQSAEFRRVCECVDAGRDPYPEANV